MYVGTMNDLTAPASPPPPYSGMADYMVSNLLLHRNLAATQSLIDYTVLSVALLTLGLILVVEIARHKIDRRAHGRPFARTVLEQVYRELSTLGIVEFAIFLGHTYAPNFNLEVEAVFAKVHFLLFFTAIINALMSVILSFVASRISYKLWVRTEELELNHYIAIREEFSRVEKKLGEYMDVGGGGSDDAATAAEYHTLLWTPRRAFNRLRQTLRYPLLRRQYDKLLVQVRFHELRVHFLEANDLPLKFKVSDYLVKSELHVFKKCVHISTLAWIMVAAAVNLVYFLMGIVATTSGSQQVVGTAMSWIFIGGCLAFIPISYAIFVKMQWIFVQIMKMKLIDHRKDHDHHNGDGDGEDDDDDEEEDDEYDNCSASIDGASLDNDPTVGGKSRRSRASYVLSLNVSGRSVRNSTKRRKRAMNQLDLFWASDPHLVIGAFQFMQLGYAIAASILLIFWDYVDTYYASVSGKWFIVALVLCYLLFLWIMAQVVPRYTLCTSLGQLVNPRRLHETLAKCKLEEARRKRRHLMEETKMMMVVEKEVRERAVEQLKRRASLEGAGGSSNQTSQVSRAQIDSLHTPPPRYERQPSTDRISDRSLESEKMNELAKLVQTSNADLPTTGTSLSDIRRDRRKRRMRSVSDGVAFMRRMAETTGSSDAAMSVLAGEDADKTKLPVPLTKAASGRALESGLLPEPLDLSRSPNDATPGRRRRSRKKALSSNMALMRTPPTSLLDPSLSLVAEEKEEEACPLNTAMRRPSLDSGLPALIEGIPSRSVKREELSRSMEKVTQSRNKPVGPANLSAVEKNASSHSDASSDSGIIAKTVGDIGGGSLRDLADNVAGAHPGGAKPVDGKIDNDDDTINTAASDHSFDDVPAVAASVKSAKQRQNEVHTTAHRFSLTHLREFMQTQSYRLMSGVFGTMIAFFLVGMRVEIFLIETGTISDNQNTWQLNLTGSFWWEVAWLSSFITISTVSAVLFFNGCSDNDYLHLVVASIFDLFLSVICLALLLGAEARRCCSEGGDCCDQFGSRTYGGLGNIEPWTALVAFRVFRYSIGRLVRRMFRRKTSHLKEGSDSYTKSRRKRREEKADEYGYMTKDNEHAEKARAKFEAETGNIVDLWNTAIGLYPDVVKQYGEFSGELLQAMLGIEIVEGAAPLIGSMVENTKPAETVVLDPLANLARTDQKESEASVFARKENINWGREGCTSSGEPPPISGAAPSSTTMPLPSLDKKYANLDPDCQGIILAGRIGRPVRQKSRRPTRGGTSADNFFLNSLRSQGSSESTQPARRASGGVGGGPVFVLDKQQDKEEHTGGSESMAMFAEPNARLIRSMRRCERRLPPMLNEWAVVDVVLTKYEIVYFDANDIDHLGTQPSTAVAASEVEAIELQHKRDTVRQALIATKGGKGLRLRDIALGRKVVGHIELSEITTIKVERYPPLPHKEEEGIPDVDLEDGMSVHHDEYWHHKTKSPIAHRARQHRWRHAMEDRMRVVSAQGDLYLRFFTDLNDWESNASAQVATAGTTITKNQSLLWTQTIGRLCGADQLQQKLPHLGDDGDAELLDLIDSMSRELDQTDRKTTPLHRRIKSRVNLLQLGEMLAHQPSGIGGVALDVDSGAPSPGELLKKRLRRKSSAVSTVSNQTPAVTFNLPGEATPKVVKIDSPSVDA